MKRVFLKVLTNFLLICALVSGCGPASESPTAFPHATPMRDIGDGGFLSGEPCGPPCFLNIIPGVTKEEQAIQILQEYFSIQDCDQWDTRNEGGTQGIGCPHIILGYHYTIEMDFNDQDIVDGLNFSPTKIITIEDVFTRYGIPEGVDVISWTEEDDVPTEVFMTLYYDKISMRLGLPIQESDTYTVSPSTKIESISYPWESCRERALDCQSWRGFGEYIVNIP